MRLHELTLPGTTYKEIEFVCSNPEFADATAFDAQTKLFQALLDLPGLLVYRQNWDEYSEGQNSLAAIILDRDNENQLQKTIRQLAAAHNVEVDLEHRVSNAYVDSIVTGEVEGLVRVVDTSLTEGKEELSEGISPIVYHYTNVNNAIQILQTNRFRLAASVGVDSEREHQKEFYFLSTTRHRLGGYHVDSPVQGVMLELDGKKFAHHYKGQPVDYWGPGWGPATRKEAEDRIYSPKPYIEDAKSYIKSIHMFVGDWAREHFADRFSYYKDAYSLAKKNNIPVYFYENKEAWLTQFRYKSHYINHKGLPEYIRTAKSDLTHGKYQSRQKELAKRNLGPWIELYTINDKNRLSKPASDLLYNLRYDSYGEIAGSLKADMHNNKTNPEGGMTTLLNIFRKEGIHSPKEYVTILQDKWRTEA